MAGASNSTDHHDFTVLAHLADLVFAILIRIFAHNGVVDVVVERRAKLTHTTTILGAFVKKRSESQGRELAREDRLAFFLHYCV